MKRYDWILFDIDETLLRFNSYDALKMLFTHYDHEFTHDHFSRYETINRSLWTAYQNGEITFEQLQHDRFIELGELLDTHPLELDKLFLDKITTITTPLEGAEDLLNALKPTTKLGLISNGFSHMQKMRIENAGFLPHFDFLVTSEEVGYPKPHNAIFDHTFALMNHPPRDTILIVGDTLESDILGGIKAGIDTCWINHHKKAAPAHITPHMEVYSLSELSEKYIK